MEATERVKQGCSNCKTHTGVLKRCSGCKTVLYCSKFCQQKHWPKHKPMCKQSTQTPSQDSSNQVQQCANCNKYDGDLKKCTGCKAAAYCSKLCQRNHWPEHKTTCRWSSQNGGSDYSSYAKQCADCEAYDEDLKPCPGCRRTGYCSESCRIEHWPEHKSTCTVLLESARERGTLRTDPTNRKRPKSPIPVYIHREEREFGTGAALGEKRYPTVDIFLPSAPSPDTEEFSLLIRRLKRFQRRRGFFETPHGESFSFTAVFRDVVSDRYLTSPFQANDTILIGKIVSMDQEWMRHGLLVMVRVMF